MSEQVLHKRREGTEPIEGQEIFRVPAADICESDERVIILVDMPGVDGSRVEVTVDDDILTITGRRANTQSKQELIYCEFDEQPYRREFVLSSELRQNEIQGKMTNGVLRLSIPKSGEPRARKIPIKSV